MHWTQKKGALLRVPWGSRLGASGARALFRPFRPDREGDLWVGVLLKTGDFRSFDVIRQHIRQFGWRQAAKPAIGTQSKVGQIFAGGCDPLLEARHAVDGAKIDARAPGLELLEWCKERIVAAIEHWDVHPVDPPSGFFDAGIGELDRLPEVIGSEARPAAERAEAEVIAERDLLRDVRRETAHLRQAALDSTVERKSRNGAVGVLDLGRAVPLDGKLARRNLRHDGG